MQRTAKRALWVGLVGFVLWGLLDAPTLLHNAEVSPLGARRSVAIDVLRPLARVTDWLSLDRPVALVDAVRSGHWLHGAPPATPTRPVVAAPVTQPPIAKAPGQGASGGADAAQPVSAVVTPTTIVGPLRTPTTANPLRLLVVGDSIGSSVGYALAERLDSSGLVHTVVDGRPDTGLSRPDYFDWNHQLSTDLARDNPDVVVAMFGGNDAQSFIDHGRVMTMGTPEWLAAYRSRVQALSQLVTTSGARLVWVGLPIMRSATFSSDAQMLDGAYATVVGGWRSQARYVDTWSTLATTGGHYTDYLPDSGGRLQLVRQPDGVHLAAGGTSRISAVIMAAMQQSFGFPVVT